MLIADLMTATFRLEGADVEPLDGSFRTATERQRQAYYQQLAVYARDRKYAELHKGLDVDGRTMPPRKYPRADRAHGRVLSPHFSDSRFQTQLRWKGTATAAILWWTKRWAKVVSAHALGRVRGAPVRNVIGLTVESILKAVNQARKWWAARAGLPGKGPGPAVTLAPGDRELIERSTEGFERVRAALGLPPRPVVVPPSPVPPLPPMPFIDVAPKVGRGLDRLEVLQRLLALFDATARGQASRRAIERTMDQLRAEHSTATLRFFLERFGVLNPPEDRDELIRLLRRAFLDRLREALALMVGLSA